MGATVDGKDRKVVVVLRVEEVEDSIVVHAGVGNGSAKKSSTFNTRTKLNVQHVNQGGFYVRIHQSTESSVPILF